nr:hypothetical protein [Desulfobacula sp.]
MNQDFGSLELAKLYERQGYYKDALETYLCLEDQNTGPEIQAGIKRMAEKIKEAHVQTPPGEKISVLFEKWLMLMVLRHRLDNFIKIRKRLF